MNRILPGLGDARVAMNRIGYGWTANDDHFRTIDYPIPATHPIKVGCVVIYSVIYPVTKPAWHVMMTKQQLQLVKQTWKLLREVDPAVLGDVFYSRLFFKYPALRLLFKSPMVIQYQKFVDMLSIIVARLDRPDTVAQEIVMLARSHAGYGVQPSHYEDVKEALLWTLERGLGLDWNADTQEAWIVCYDSLTQLMLEQAD